MTAATLELGPRCAVHPELPARETPCERCGSFACEACFGAEPGIDALDAPAEPEVLCRSCRERTGRGTVPWEDARLPFWRRLGLTLQRALGAPVTTFEAIGEGDLGRAVSFSIVSALLGYAPMLALVLVGLTVLLAFGLPGDAPFASANGLVGFVLLGFVFVLPFFLLAVSLFTDLVFAVVFHVAALLLGGKGSFEGSLRGALYTGAVRVVLAPMSVFVFVPLIGPLVDLVARVGMLVWCGFALSGTARRVHRLDASRAALAGAAAPLGIALIFLGLIGLGVALALPTALDEMR